MTDSSSLESELAGIEERYGGRFSLDVRRLDTRFRFSIREHDILPSASTCKLFLLCELFRQAENGELDLDSPVSAVPDLWCGGDGILRAMKPDQSLSVYNMAVLMTALSDNIATAVLGRCAGRENIERSVREWGFKDTSVAQSLEQWPSSGGGPGPVTSPNDLCTLLEKIFRHELLDPESCEEIIRIMRAQRINDMLPRYIPVGEDWGSSEQWIASKTGYGRCTVETGIVHTRTIDFCIAVFFKPDRRIRPVFKCLADHPPVLAAAEACRAVYCSLTGEKPPAPT